MILYAGTEREFMIDTTATNPLKIGHVINDTTTVSLESRGNAQVVIDSNDNGTTASFMFSVNEDGDAAILRDCSVTGNIYGRVT